jgi:DNA repair exonuclease SbcCD ATPase subunit
VKLAFVDLCGFRGYQRRLRIEFANRFTIIDGRNGVGKSTVFDAIEFALTGSLGKYDNATASGESAADYLWWTGEGPAPNEYYVEVGFREGEEEISIRRTRLGKVDSLKIALITEKLCDPKLAPASPLNQLCASAIIRDEHITSLSLDLKETDRYALLRDALGANDSEHWISRSAQLVTLTKRRTASIQDEVTSANAEAAAAARRIDEVRANIVSEAVVAEAAERLRSFANTKQPADELPSPVRERIATVLAELQGLQDLRDRWSTVERERSRLDALSKALDAASLEKDAASKQLESLTSAKETTIASTFAAQARDLIALVTLGRQIGLRDGHCPLCAQEQSDGDYLHGLAAAETIAKGLDEQAARAAEREQARRAAEARVGSARRDADVAASARATVVNLLEAFDRQRKAQDIPDGATIDHVAARMDQLRQRLEAAQKDLRIVETLRLSADLERAQRAEADAKNRLVRAQERFGRVRKAEMTAQALHDAARRAAGETLGRRLERVLPLMSELYRRLRPHPVWSDIEYSIRGDVRRFLKLQVGNDLNPQFLFSSGQRRATGLAFLLSVNLSLAWSRWSSIMLDDPVQHVDDFRAVHLVEVMAQLVTEGRQIICAVEDAALADLLCRRLPVDQPGEAKHITLGQDADGALAKLAERSLPSPVRLSLFATPEQSATG